MRHREGNSHLASKWGGGLGLNLGLSFRPMLYPPGL